MRGRVLGGIATFAAAPQPFSRGDAPPEPPDCGNNDLRSAGIIRILEKRPGHGLFPVFDLTLQAAARG